MDQRFLDRSREGNTQPSSFFGALTITWVAWLLVGGLPMGILLGYLNLNNPEAVEAWVEGASLQSLPVSEYLVFSLMMAQFIFGWAGLWLGTKLVLKRALKTLMTGFERFRWGRLFLGMGIWMAVITLFFAGVSLKEPGLIKFEPNWNRFWPYLPLILFWVPIQSSFEEVAFRGQMMQTSYFRSGFRPFMPLLTSSALFALFHSLNPEVATYGWGTMMGLYMVIGLVMGIFTILDDGLELAMGIHTGNNLFAFLFLSYPGSVLDVPTLYQLDSFSPAFDLLSVLTASLVLFVILYGRQPGILRKIFMRGRTEDAEGEAN